MAAAATSSSSSIDAPTAKILAAVSYVIPIIGLVLYFILKKGENDFARFHALQSLLLGVVFVIIGFGVTIVATVFSIIPFLGWIVALLIFFASTVLYLAFFLFALFCLFKVMKDEKFKLPIIGNFAEKNC